MFKRVIHEEWMEFIPYAAFGIIFAVFIVATIRALRIKTTDREHLAALPLDNDPTNPQ